MLSKEGIIYMTEGSGVGPEVARGLSSKDPGPVSPEAEAGLEIIGKEALVGKKEGGKDSPTREKSSFSEHEVGKKEAPYHDWADKILSDKELFTKASGDEEYQKIKHELEAVGLSGKDLIREALARFGKASGRMVKEERMGQIRDELDDIRGDLDMSADDASSETSDSARGNMAETLETVEEESGRRQIEVDEALPNLELSGIEEMNALINDMIVKMDRKIQPNIEYDSKGKITKIAPAEDQLLALDLKFIEARRILRLAQLANGEIGILVKRQALELVKNYAADQELYKAQLETIDERQKVQVGDAQTKLRLFLVEKGFRFPDDAAEIAKIFDPTNAEEFMNSKHFKKIQGLEKLVFGEESDVVKVISESINRQDVKQAAGAVKDTLKELGKVFSKETWILIILSIIFGLPGFAVGLGINKYTERKRENTGSPSKLRQEQLQGRGSAMQEAISSEVNQQAVLSTPEAPATATS